MLQREVPDHINLAAAKIAKENKDEERIVILDMGGTDAPISGDLVSLLDYISPNETELKTLLTLADEIDTEHSEDIFQFQDIFNKLL